MNKDFEISSYSVVLLGRFNPSIFTPSWFEINDLLTKSEVANAEIEVIHPDVSRFVADWLTLYVDTERFSASTTQPPIQLRDFIVKLFRDYLNHTPVHSLGINREVHYKFTDPKTRLKLGRALAPTEPWGEWGKKIDEGNPDLPSGVMNVTMRELKPSTGTPGYTQVIIQPSPRIPGLTGVFLQVNDHYELSDKRDVLGSNAVISLLEEKFDESIERTNWILNQVLGPWEK